MPLQRLQTNQPIDKSYAKANKGDDDKHLNERIVHNCPNIGANPRHCTRNDSSYIGNNTGNGACGRGSLRNSSFLINESSA